MPPKTKEELEQLFYTLSATEILVNTETAASLLWMALRVRMLGDETTAGVERGVEQTLDWALGEDDRPEFFQLSKLISTFEFLLVESGSVETGWNPETTQAYYGILAWLLTVKEGLFGDRDAFINHAVGTVLSLFKYAELNKRPDLIEKWGWIAQESQEKLLPNPDLTVGQPSYEEFKESLEVPPPQWVDPLRALRPQLPHVYEPGEDFPRSKLLNRLQNYAEVLQAGVVGVELVLPFWGRTKGVELLDITGQAILGSPFEIVVAVKKYIHGEFGRNDLAQVSQAAEMFMGQAGLTMQYHHESLREIIFLAAINLLIAAAIEADKPYQTPYSREYLDWIPRIDDRFWGRVGTDLVRHNIELSVGLAAFAFRAAAGASMEEFFGIWGAEVINTVIPVSAREEFFTLSGPPTSRRPR